MSMMRYVRPSVARVIPRITIARKPVLRITPIVRNIPRPVPKMRIQQQNIRKYFMSPPDDDDNGRKNRDISTAIFFLIVAIVLQSPVFLFIAVVMLLF